MRWRRSKLALRRWRVIEFSYGSRNALVGAEICAPLLNFLKTSAEFGVLTASEPSAQACVVVIALAKPGDRVTAKHV